ncbi:helix-turn-helix domain-containing protein [Sinomicrobium sp. M5D2P9]
MDIKELRKIYMKEFSKNLIAIREKKYGTQKDLATSSDFDSSNYNKYELGEGNPTIETLLKIAYTLDVDPKDLLDFDFDIKKYKLDI